MSQITVRMSDQLAADVRAAAEARGSSMNAFVTAVLRAAVDPDTAEPGIAQLRERLARAGLLAERRARPRGSRPDPGAVSGARRRAGEGTSLSALVSADRG